MYTPKSLNKYCYVMTHWTHCKLEKNKLLTAPVNESVVGMALVFFLACDMITVCFLNYTSRCSLLETYFCDGPTMIFM